MVESSDSQILASSLLFEVHRGYVCIEKSSVDGFGCFAACALPAGLDLGPAAVREEHWAAFRSAKLVETHENKCPAWRNVDAARYLNHGDAANVHIWYNPDISIYGWETCVDIAKGDELLANYCCVPAVVYQSLGIPAPQFDFGLISNNPWPACFTCGAALDLEVLSEGDLSVDVYAVRLHQNRWRAGLFEYDPKKCPKQCDLRHMRIDLHVARGHYCTKDGSVKVRHLKPDQGAFKKIETTLVPTTIRSGHMFEEIYALYQSYQRTRDPHDPTSNDKGLFIERVLKSPLGAVPLEDLVRLEKELSSQSEQAASFTLSGSALALLRVDGKLGAVTLVDFLGPSGLCGKTFWYSAGFLCSPTQAIIMKEMQIGWRLGLPHLYLSYYDPCNSRLRYKATIYKYVAELLEPASGKWFSLCK